MRKPLATRPAVVVILPTALLTAREEPAKEAGTVDAVYLGGKVFTADPARPRIEAIATLQERIARETETRIGQRSAVGSPLH